MGRGGENAPGDTHGLWSSNSIPKNMPHRNVYTCAPTGMGKTVTLVPPVRGNTEMKQCQRTDTEYSYSGTLHSTEVNRPRPQAATRAPPTATEKAASTAQHTANGFISAQFNQTKLTYEVRSQNRDDLWTTVEITEEETRDLLQSQQQCLFST